MTTLRNVLIGSALSLALTAPGCGQNPNAGDGGGPADLTFTFPENDLAGTNPDGGDVNPCGDNDPSCVDDGFGPGTGKPFPLRTDMPPDPNSNNDGVSRDKDGYLGLDSSHASYDYLWVANSEDLGSRGTTSKFNSKTIREVARYLTVTCNSLKTGGKQACDGQNGCCAMDSNPQFLNRKANQAQGPYQQVQTDSNAPSRTAIDFNGDMWVANRAFGGQASATKIANDITSCLDRNKNGKIDTSSDVNGDGVIQVDCNGDQEPDDLASVQAMKCSNGMAQEFYGLDDECILFTTNTERDSLGRPLTLGPGAQDFGPSDAWAGMYENAHFYRIDGTTGITKADSQLPQGCQPYGAVVDSSGILWTGTLGSPPLCFLDTKKPTSVGLARTPQVGDQQGYGIGLDRDQNIWLGCLSFGVCRYTPNRKNGFADLDKGYWTMIENPGGNGGGGFSIGIAVDSRSQNAYFAWSAGNDVVARIPASTLALPNGMDVLVDGANYPVAHISGDGKGVGVDRDQNVWNISGSGTTGATRITIDAMGTITQPDLVSPPKGNNLCPAGDRCEHMGNNPWDPSPYTYSDFTGFGLRNFTRPKGFYNYVQKGCVDENGMPNGETRWMAVKWDADVPLNTTLTMRARAGNTPVPDLNWGAWTADFAVSPADLVAGMPLVPNQKDSAYIQVEFDFATNDKNASPKLKSFNILHECIGGIG